MKNISPKTIKIHKFKRQNKGHNFYLRASFVESSRHVCAILIKVVLFLLLFNNGERKKKEKKPFPVQLKTSREKSLCVSRKNKEIVNFEVNEKRVLSNNE
jgi:hypothetical protein